MPRMKRRKLKFAKRPICLFTVLCLMFASLIGRMAYICGMSSYPAAARSEYTGSYILDESRGKIYDANMISFYLYEEKTVYVKLNPVFESGGGFAVIDDDGGEGGQPSKYCSEKVTLAKQTSVNTSCRHIVGYTDESGHGVCGIQRAFDRILSEGSGTVTAEYCMNAIGQPLPGAGVEIKNDNYNSPAGVVLTVDIRIQQIVENALENSDIECGACVVLRPSTGEILASASVPVYDAASLSDDLVDSRKPLLNRVLCAYPVGSVFKPFVAAAAAADGADLDSEYDCTGSIQVGDTTFGCYERRQHGKINLTGAIENSCNCYFIEKGLSVSPETLYDVCSSFGFGKEIRLFSDTVSSSGNMPFYGDNTQKGQTANLCFGQGELLATPLQVAAAYGALANGGTYKEPYILKYLTDDTGLKYAEYRSEASETATDVQTCRRINEALYMNMIDGTGKNGSPDVCSSAGKTATAQTGEYDENGHERLCTWFAGFFPFESPEYTVVVFNENGNAAAVDCAPVFKEIAEKITMSVNSLS